MEVESCDNYSVDNNTLPEKKPKRSVKTPPQIDALETLYEEHKYPSESLKLQLAESVGLTEKQVSGWFCHRRSKDKRLKDETSALGKQDRSSGVIQDRGSGLRQDSCGSTKQWELRHFDPREVESRRFAVEELLAAEIANEIENRSIVNQNGTDVTSSGSSSPQDTYFPQSTAPRRFVTSRNLTQKANIVSMDVRDSKGRSGPSGYLKVKLQSENGAITSVKRQLGRHYREDGPPLGIDFDPLPPGAFESPIKRPVEEPDFVDEQKLHQSPYDSRAGKRPYPSTGFEEYNSKMSSYNYDLDGNPKFAKKSTLSYQRNSVSMQYPSMMINEDYYTGEPPLYDDYQMRARQDAGRTKEPVSSHFQLQNGRKLNGKQRVPSNHGDGLAKSTQIKYFESSPSNFQAEQNKFLHWEERGLPRTGKEVDIFKERRQSNYCHDPAKVSFHPTNLAKRSREGFLQQQHITKTTTGKMTPWTNPSKGSALELPSSFSEDETGQTSSSADQVLGAFGCGSHCMKL